MVVGRRAAQWIAIGAVGLAVLGCERADDGDEALQPLPTEATSTTAATATTTSTTAPTTTTTTTEVATTTTTAAPTTTSSTTTTSISPTTTTTVPEFPLVINGSAPDSAIAVAEMALIEVDVATGATLRVIQDFFNGDGIFRGGLQVTADRQTLWYSEVYEDSWFACDSSKGTIGRMALEFEAPETEAVALGYGASISPDGSRIAYVSTSLCLPDPENPEFWVLTPADRAVVINPRMPSERFEFVTATAPDSYGAPSEVTWAGFAFDGAVLVHLGDGNVHRVPIDSTLPIQDHPVYASGVAERVVGVVGDVLIGVLDGDEGSSDLLAIEPESGSRTLLASSENPIDVGVAPSGHLLVTSFGVVEVVPGAPVTVLDASSGVVYFGVDW